MTTLFIVDGGVNRRFLDADPQGAAWVGEIYDITIRCDELYSAPPVLLALAGALTESASGVHSIEAVTVPSARF